MIIGNMIRVNIPLSNKRVWRRRGDGSYPHCLEPLAWLAERDCHYQLSSEGKAIQDAVGYDGYQYGSKVKFFIVSGTFAITYSYGDIRLGPDSHLYSDPGRTYGPISGHYWFNTDQSSLVLMFKLFWGGEGSTL
jgi:hypothetical protein